MLGSLLTPAPAAAELSDVGILRFGLRFEYLQAAFYTEAEQIGTIGRMTARKQQWARVLAQGPMTPDVLTQWKQLMDQAIE